MSKILDQMDDKLRAFETLERMLKYCSYQIVSCECTSNISLHYNHDTGYFVVNTERGFPDLESAIQKFSDLTEH